LKTKFKKITLLTRERTHKALTRAMQDFGLLHIEQIPVEANGHMEDLIHECNQVDRTIRFLQKEAASPHDKSHVPLPAGREKEMVEHLRQQENDIEAVRQQIEKCQKQADDMDAWGDYSYHKFEALMNAGWQVYLCRAEEKQWAGWNPQEAFVEMLDRKGSEIYFIVISRQPNLSSSFESLPLPERSSSDIRQELHVQEQRLESMLNELQTYVPYQAGLRSYLSSLDDAIALSETESKYTTHFEGKLLSLSAWFPANKEQDVIDFFNKEKIAWEIRDPFKGEDVPVMLRNRSYPRLFEPITKIFELPNYFETDTTPFLAVFYPILFAYCLGDAGYGLVLTAAMV